MPNVADHSAVGRRKARLESARLRAEFFAQGGVIKRYPAWHHGPDHRFLQSGWGIRQLRMRRYQKKKEESKQ